MAKHIARRMPEPTRTVAKDWEDLAQMVSQGQRSHLKTVYTICGCFGRTLQRIPRPDRRDGERDARSETATSDNGQLGR